MGSCRRGKLARYIVVISALLSILTGLMFYLYNHREQGFNYHMFLIEVSMLFIVWSLFILSDKTGDIIRGKTQSSTTRIIRRRKKQKVS